MSKKDKIYTRLDEMVIKLNEKKRALAVDVRTGHITNGERHEQFNQFYVRMLAEYAETLTRINTEPTDAEA